MRLFLFIFLITISSLAQEEEEKKSYTFTAEDMAAAEKLSGLSFTDEEHQLMFERLDANLELYKALRAANIPNQAMPSMRFSPIPPGMTIPKTGPPPQFADPGKVALPERREDLAWYSVSQLGKLIKTGQLTSVEITRIYIKRLKQFDPQLHCVITLLEKDALAQAAKMDGELAAGRWRGPLHGIPYGVKDLFSLKGYKTTWGAAPYQDQMLDETAEVIEKLEEAGAVLIAKTTLGALAMGDVWFGEKTRNPWNLEQGSSGSSAGSASAVSAGLMAFAIGTETYGSIVSPSTRCGVTGLRPTFGRVSRHGAMALSWSMDKVGPICRSAEDCALVFDAIRGGSAKDPYSVEAPFSYRGDIDLSKLRIGYLKSAFDRDYTQKETDAATLQTLRDAGATLIPLELPDFPIQAMSVVLRAEAAAAFEELTLSNRDDLLVRQDRHAWPTSFRAAHHIPAVAYIQADRMRGQLIMAMKQVMEKVDVYIAPSFGSANLLLTNLTGHPCVVMPNGFIGEKGNRPVSISFIGGLFDEATLLAVAGAYQKHSNFHIQRPPLTDVK